LHERANTMRQRQRFWGAFVAVCVSVSTMVAGIVGASSASATTTTRTAQTTISGSTSVNGVALTSSSLLGVTVGATGLDGSIDWQQQAAVSTQFDTDAVRQGRSVDPVVTATRANAGTMVANWSLSDLTVAFPGYFPFDIGTIGLSSSGNCDLQFGGAAYVCHLGNKPSTIVDSSPSPGPYVRAALSVDLTITPQALATLRTASIAGTTTGTANLALGETSITDPLDISCSAGTGGKLTYALGTLSTTPGVSIAANLQLQVGSSIDNPAYPDTDPNPIVYLPPLAQPTFPFATVDTTIPMSGAGPAFDLGGVQPDDRPITADAGGPYSGVEGSPIAFDASGTTVGCGSPSYQWTFSDGGSADGVQPTHTFSDNGTYSGTLTVSEGARTDQTTFSVTVDNAAPSVDAGGDVSSSPGSVVTFVGTANDPSTVDQSTLEYTWNFGDGSPAATAAGGSATHTYSTPGTYDATLTVCDKDGGCNGDSRRITVAAQAQPTLLVYFGDFIGRTGSNSDMRAILVDRDLHPLVGRTITFTLGGQTVSATTDSRGVATTTLRVTAGRGLHALSATWRPGGTDVQQYAGSSMTVPFLVLPR
jgi:PKD repeat protein